MDGRHPYWQAMLLTRTIRPAAVRAGIDKRIGWHTFRHTYSTMLVANGENVKVIQELMCHASSRSTLEIYSQARTADKRAAQQRVVQMIFSEDLNRGQSIDERNPEQPAVTFDWVN
jgi:integrase